MEFQKIREVAIKDLEDYSRLRQGGSSADTQRAATINRALQMLPKREQDILNEFFIEREKRYAGHVARLTATYGLSLAELYRLKNQALTNYFISLLMLKAAAK